MIECWTLTWEEVLEKAAAREAIVSLEGYLLCSRDRKFDERVARDMYEGSVARAIARGKDVPHHVRWEYYNRIIANGITPEHAKRAAFDPPPPSQSVQPQETPMPQTSPLLRPPSFTWSYSALTDFENCPHAFGEKRYFKRIKEPESQAMADGNADHKSLELRLRDGKPLPPTFACGVSGAIGEKFCATFEKIARARGGKIVTEQEIALTEKLKPTSWFGKDTWARGKLDVVIDFGDRVWICDWKGLALDTPLPTPSGWTTMGEVKEGDAVFGADGKPCTVVGKSQIHNRRCYRLKFCDGHEVVCDDQHLWAITTGRAGQYKDVVLGIQDLYEGFTRKDRENIYRVKLAGALDLPEIDLPIHPYVLGCWLGDGKHTSGEISNPDAELFDNIESFGYAVGHDIGSSERCTSRTVYGLRTQLGKANLLRNKHIPAKYLRASYGQRLLLLQGIMDTDGSWNKVRRQAVFTSIDEHFARQVKELAASLGQRPNLFTVTKRGFGKVLTGYDVVFTPIDINPFRLTRKGKDVTAPKQRRSYYRVIREIEEIPSVPTQCIAVDSPDNLYLCGRGMIPTHNTGKVKHDEFQVHLFFAFAALAYPNAKEFHGKFVWLKDDKITGPERPTSRQEVLGIWKDVLPRVKRMRDAWDSGVFPCRPNGLCKAWCPVLTCEHNGRR